MQHREDGRITESTSKRTASAKLSGIGNARGLPAFLGSPYSNIIFPNSVLAYEAGRFPVTGNYTTIFKGLLISRPFSLPAVPHPPLYCAGHWGVAALRYEEAYVNTLDPQVMA